MAKNNKSANAITYVESIKQAILALQQHQDAQMKTLLDKLKVAEEEEERKNATGLIAKAVADAKESLARAQELALKYDLEFEWDGPTYGMGGVFNGTDWDASNYEDERPRTGHWLASSNSC